MSVTTIDFDAAYAELTAAALEEQQARLTPPLVRFWDGNWQLRGRVERINSANIVEKNNETGSAVFELPLDYYISDWIIDFENRTELIHATIEKDGVRWSGRLDEFSVVTMEDGSDHVRIAFKHEYEEIKALTVFPNPFLMPELQFPKVWLAFAPAKYACKLTALVNIMRVESSIWQIPDDALDPAQWFNFNQSTWWMVVKPDAFGNDNSPLAIVHSRMGSLHEATSATMDDAQLTWTFRRFLTGDDPPWPGANLRHGCLVIDIEDKGNRYNNQTSNGGDLFGGLIRSITTVGNDGWTEGVDVIDDPDFPPEYSDPNWQGTMPSAPWVTYRDGIHTAIATSEFTVKAATAVQIVSGGHSMPFVNELISQAIEMAGDLTAMIPFTPPIGGALDSVLKPLYCLAGLTKIDGPDGSERIDVLARRGTPFRVWSLTPEGKRVPAYADYAFKKGEAELFEYTLANGATLTATAQHRWLTKGGWLESGHTAVGTGVATCPDPASARAVQAAPDADLPDSAWVGLREGADIEYSALISVRSVGVQEFFDMHVPGWVNYLAGHIWNHNTDAILAFGAQKVPGRAARLGGSHYREHFQDGTDRAYTLGYLLAMRLGAFQTERKISHELTVVDGAPYKIGQAGLGHFYVGDKVGTTVRGMKYGTIFVDQVTEVGLEWSRDKAPEWKITLGHREPRDPVVEAFKKLQDVLTAIHELGMV